MCPPGLQSVQGNATEPLSGWPEQPARDIPIIATGIDLGEVGMEDSVHSAMKLQCFQCSVPMALVGTNQYPVVDFSRKKKEIDILGNVVMFSKV
jgi:hypothetical protein